MTPQSHASAVVVAMLMFSVSALVPGTAMTSQGQPDTHGNLVPEWSHAIEQISARTWVVNPTGPGSSITDALAAANDGDTVLVTGGRYRESVLSIEKSVALIGRNNPIIEGDSHELIVILADNVTVSGFTLQGVSRSFMDDRSAIRIEEASNCVISDNHFRDNFFAIYVAKSKGCVIERNDISGSGSRETEAGNGIHLWYCRDMVIRDNRIHGHRDGIYFEFVEDSDVTGNYSEGNLRYGLHFMFSDRCRYSRNEFRKNRAGVAIMYSEHVEIIENNFIRNWGSATFGLLMKEIDDSNLIGNRFDRNSVALFVEGSNRMRVEANTFEGNGWAIKIMANSEDNLVSKNNFLHNSFDVSTNSRSAVSTFVNNYWDSYKGYDLNHDGYGDRPHRPVRFFSIVVEQYEPALALLNSAFVHVLDLAEDVLPIMTPKLFTDDAPSIRPWPAVPVAQFSHTQ